MLITIAIFHNVPNFSEATLYEVSGIQEWAEDSKVSRVLRVKSKSVFVSSAKTKDVTNFDKLIECYAFYGVVDENDMCFYSLRYEYEGSGTESFEGKIRNSIKNNKYITVIEAVI